MAKSNEQRADEAAEALCDLNLDARVEQRGKDTWVIEVSDLNSNTAERLVKILETALLRGVLL